MRDIKYHIFGPKILLTENLGRSQILQENEVLKELKKGEKNTKPRG